LIQEWSRLSEADILRRYAWPVGHWSRANIVVDPQGKPVGSDGTSASLTSANDRTILRTVRQHADLVVVGAQSVRSEGWFLPPQGRLTVVSRSAELPEGCPEPARVDVTTLENLLPQLGAVTHWLCEGGPTVLTHLMESNPVDEICLTIAGWTPRDPIGLPGWLTQRGIFTYTATSLISDGESLFTIWRRAKN
jgi:riboflavin biosynthesis pyrimidine reductase